MNISISQINMTYPTGKKALRDISINIDSPNLVGIVGPKGSGKSTLMKLLVTELLPSFGQITFDGQPLLKNEKKLKSSLGYLPQSFGLYEDLTVYQFLNYIAALKGIRHAKTMINQVILETNLEEIKKIKIRTLSAAQRQRIGIAQAMLGEPKLLILDEPTAYFDPEERNRFRSLFSNMANDRIVILSTHIIEDVQSICNRLIILNEGKVIYDDPPEKLIRLAQNHVAIINEKDLNQTNEKILVAARMNTINGVRCRIVSQELPDNAIKVDPSLEDAYLYILSNSN